MLEMMESGIAASPEEFENIIVNIIRVVNPTSMSAVYEDLKFTGNLKLIRNRDLKQSIISYYATVELLREQISSISVESDFIDLIDYEELIYRKPFSQEVILSNLRKNEGAKRNLRQLQRSMHYHSNAMIYTMLPNCLELLDKINKELESE